MERDQAEDICAALPGAWPDSPWDHDLVYKIGPRQVDAKGRQGGKIFCFLGGGPSDGRPVAISIKADPDQVPALHRQYDAVSSPRYLNKRHWIAVQLDGDLPDEELQELIEDSHRLVRQTFSKRVQREIMGSSSS